MITPRTRTFAGSLAWILVVLGLVTPATPAAAATCTTTSGVSVIVDFGGSLRTGCAPGDPGSAWGALQAAGFSVEGTRRFPTSFVCRINGYPAPADEACVATPPATAYWAFHHGPAGGGWTYSNNGAATYDPAPGTAVGFAFGAGATPGMTPPTPSAPNPRPTSTSTTRTSTTGSTRPTTSTRTHSTASTSTSSTGAARSTDRESTGPGSTAPDSTDDSTSTGVASTGSSSRTTSSAGGAAASTGPRAPTAAPEPASGSSPSAVAFALVAGVVILLGIAAYEVSRRRRLEMGG